MMRYHIILRAAAAILAPPILLFALYVQFHGEVSPGGGFQAGVIMATGIILYGLVFGAITIRNLISIAQLRIVMSVGTLIYGGVGIAGMIYGGAFLDYAPLAETARAGRHLGITLIEIGVGVTVASTMIAIFHSFATRHRLKDDP